MTTQSKSLPEDNSDVLSNFRTQLSLSDSNQKDSTLIWKGFRHFWRRSFMGNIIPHRVQSISNYILDEVQKMTDGKILGKLSLGQRNVVDGNFMSPKSIYSGFSHKHIRVKHGEVLFSWIDTVPDTTYPKARSTIHQQFSIPISELDIPVEFLDQATVLLRGYFLDTSVLSKDSKDPRPQGFWPYRMYFSVKNLRKDKDYLTLDVATHIHRAWTPNRGGLPYIFEMPMAKKLHFKIKLFFTIIAGDGSHFQYSTKAHRNHGQARTVKPKTNNVRVKGSKLKNKYSVTGFQSFGFEFHPIREKPKFQHLGRYIGGIEFSISDKHEEITEPTHQEHKFSIKKQVWVPKTVYNTNVNYFTETTTLHLDRNDLNILEEKTAETCLCINSDDNAKFFSTWRVCHRKKDCPAKTRQIISTE